jgi:predicted transcriptional regulator
MSDTITRAKSIFQGKNQNTNQINSIKEYQKNKKMDKGYRSKLVICIDILCSLVSNGPLISRKLSDKVEIDTNRLIPHLKLLINHDLIEKKTWSNNEIVYSITNRGLKVLSVISPIIKEAHKISIRNFKIISNTLSEAGYT